MSIDYVHGLGWQDANGERVADRLVVLVPFYHAYCSHIVLHTLAVIAVATDERTVGQQFDVDPFLHVTIDTPLVVPVLGESLRVVLCRVHIAWPAIQFEVLLHFAIGDAILATGIPIEPIVVAHGRVGRWQQVDGELVVHNVHELVLVRVQLNNVALSEILVRHCMVKTGK